MLDPSYLPLNQHYHVIMQIMIDYSFLDSVVKRNLLPTRIPLAHHSCDCVEDHIGDISHENITKIDYDFPCGSWLLTSICANLNGITHIRMKSNWMLLHLWNRVSGRLEAKYFFIQNRAIDEPYAKSYYVIKSHDFLNQPSQPLHTLFFPCSCS